MIVAVRESNQGPVRSARVGILFFVVVVAVAGVLGGQVGVAQAEAQATSVERAKAKKKNQLKLRNMFNSRYCEVFGVSSIPTGGFLVRIFNSVGLGLCPQAEWDALDFTAIAKEEGWLAAAPNGPRYWLMDTIVGAKPTNPREFGGIKMRQVATLETGTLAPPPFTRYEISRRNTWVFKKGRTIYTLTDPAGARYVMQAYTKTVDPTLSPTTLRNLASNEAAEIPAGWTFRAIRLKRPLSLAAKGSASIIRDGVRSVYQLVK